MRRRTQGFTLLELLVVIVIIGIITSFAVLSLGLISPQSELEQHGQRLRALMLLASEEAVLQGQELALQLDGQRYYFLILKDKTWLRINNDPVLRDRELPEHVSASLRVEGEVFEFQTETENRLTPRVYFFSSGEISPFNLSLSSRDAEYDYRINGNSQGVIKDVTNE